MKGERWVDQTPMKGGGVVKKRDIIVTNRANEAKLYQRFVKSLFVWNWTERWIWLEHKKWLKKRKKGNRVNYCFYTHNWSFSVHHHILSLRPFLSLALRRTQNVPFNRFVTFRAPPPKMAKFITIIWCVCVCAKMITIIIRHHPSGPSRANHHHCH